MRPFPIYAERGAGCRVWDVDGHEFIDCINNFTSMIHGYAHPKVNAAVVEQLQLGSAFGLPTSTEISLAELLCERLPAVERVRFTNSGTEAVMMALKAARAYTGRPKIAKIEGAYHGSYDYAEVSLDSQPTNWGAPDPASIAYARGTPRSVLEDVLVLPLNDIETARRRIAKCANDLAGVLIDPLPNRAGLIPATADFIEQVAAFARNVGALLIFDEVISFRLSFSGAQGLWGAAPDLTALGKIIGGGFPIGAVGGRTEVMAVFDPTNGKPAVPHGGTFSANPVSLRAGLASMQLMQKQQYERLDEIGAHVRARLNELFRRCGVRAQAVGKGSLLKVHFTDRPIHDYRSAYPSPQEARCLEVFNLGLLNHGVLAASYGLMALSTVMTDKDVEEILVAAEHAVQNVSAVAS
jgi:glutamate-1-semialdehyde 2,1-aminomutase